MNEPKVEDNKAEKVTIPSVVGGGAKTTMAA